MKTECDSSADVAVDAERVRQHRPSPGVPPGITEAAQAMDTLHTFAPNLDGPASMRAASCQLPCADKGDSNVVADSDAATAAELGQSLDADATAAEHSVSSVCDESHPAPLPTVAAWISKGARVRLLHAPPPPPRHPPAHTIQLTEKRRENCK